MSWKKIKESKCMVCQAPIRTYLIEDGKTIIKAPYGHSGLYHKIKKRGENNV